MSLAQQRQLAAELRPEAPRVDIRQAVVQSVQASSVTIRLGGSSVDVAGVRYLASYTPAASDSVWILRFGDDLLILGRIGDDTYRHGKSGSLHSAFGVPAVQRPPAFTWTYDQVSRSLPGYNSDAESSAYTGIATGQGGAPYAQLTDLNNLRVAYENLRVFVEALAKVVVQMAHDLRDEGWLQ